MSTNTYADDFSTVLDQILTKYAALIAKQTSAYGFRLQEGDAEQTARVVTFQLWTKHGDPERVITLFPKAYTRAVAKEAYKSEHITVSDRKRDQLAKADAGLIKMDKWEHSALTASTKPTTTFTDLMHSDDEDYEGYTNADVERYMTAPSLHVDLVTQGAEQLVAQALRVLEPMEKLVITLYYLEGDEKATDDWVAYLLTSYAEKFFGEPRKYSRSYVQETRTKALTKMREELGVTIDTDEADMT